MIRTKILGTLLVEIFSSRLVDVNGVTTYVFRAVTAILKVVVIWVVLKAVSAVLVIVVVVLCSGSVVSIVVRVIAVIRIVVGVITAVVISAVPGRISIKVVLVVKDASAVPITSPGIPAPAAAHRRSDRHARAE